MAYLGIVPERCARAMTDVPDDGTSKLVRVCGKAEFMELIRNLIGWAIYFAILAVGIAVIWGGFLVLTAGDNQEKVTRGRHAVTMAVVGLVIVFSAWLIVNTIITIFVPACSGQWNLVGGKFGCQ